MIFVLHEHALLPHSQCSSRSPWRATQESTDPDAKRKTPREPARRLGGEKACWHKSGGPGSDSQIPHDAVIPACFHWETGILGSWQATEPGMEGRIWENPSAPRWKLRAKARRLFSDLHVYTIAHMHTHTESEEGGIKNLVICQRLFWCRSHCWVFIWTYKIQISWIQFKPTMIKREHPAQSASG